MSRTKGAVNAVKHSTKSSKPAQEQAVDPLLASLFAASSGPISAPVRSSRTAATAKKGRESTGDQPSKALTGDVLTASTSDSSDTDEAPEQPEQRPRKRRRLSQEDDLEGAYLDKLAREEEKETLERLQSRKAGQSLPKATEDSDDTASSASNDLEDLSDVEPESAIPQHESLSKFSAEYERTRRTVFLGNVSTEAIKSKTGRKQLEAHLKSVFDEDAPETIESIRFRSTAFNMDAGPKRAAFAKKELMDETMKCTNAYVVFKTESAARKVGKQLNGTVVLDRHLHTDWLAHPTAMDHKRCVFVGNLNFVDVESNIETNEEGEKQTRRPKAKEPADSEEGLWRTFSKCGTVESVRVIRDKATRVGKGFAYVQFSDEVGTEKALALDGKKFPPMLPRLLRVSRAKRVLKKDLKRKRDENEPARGRANGSGIKRRDGRPGANGRRTSGVVFEGYRASADKGMKFKQKGKKKGGSKPTDRSSKRGAAFKAGGGKKRRDTK